MRHDPLAPPIELDTGTKKTIVEMSQKHGLNKLLQTIEFLALEDALTKSEYQKTYAARLLKIKRTTLVMKIKGLSKIRIPAREGDGLE